MTVLQDHSQTIDEIGKKLATLAKLDANYECFGANYHRYDLNPRIPEKRLSALEKKYGTRLPEHYRHFVVELGNGGAGPCYGIFKLGGGDAEDLTDYESLAKPFPWLEKIAHPRRYSIPGALYICHFGCALRFILVVSGKCRGEIWHDWQADGLGVYPAVNERGERLHFFDWYLQWLDKSIAARR